MFDNLPESRRSRERSTGQLIASVAVHTVIIALSIRLTGAVAESIVRRPIETPMQLTRAPRPPAPAPVHQTAPQSGNPARALPLDVPVPRFDTPADIPPIAPAPGFDPRRFETGPKGVSFDGPADSNGRDASRVISMQEADEPARYLDGPAPVYPPALRQVGVEGFVALRYIVGIDGRAESGSIKTMQSSNAAFIAPAIDAIAGARFRPARLRGHVVRQLVEQIVRFTVH